MVRQVAQQSQPVLRSLKQEARRRINDAEKNFQTAKLADGKLITQNPIDPVVPILTFTLNNEQVLASSMLPGHFAHV